MKYRNLRYTVVMAMVVASVGCATAPKWSTSSGDGIYVDRHGGYSVSVPAGWQWVKFRPAAPLLATRDGPDLQAIRVYYRRHREAFPKIDKVSSADMLPGELAELFVADLRESLGIAAIEVVESVPVELAGRSGFRLELSMRNKSGLRYRSIAYGCASPKGLYVLIYHAPVLHYYDQHVAEFEESVRSFRLPA